MHVCVWHNMCMRPRACDCRCFMRGAQPPLRAGTLRVSPGVAVLRAHKYQHPRATHMAHAHPHELGSLCKFTGR